MFCATVGRYDGKFLTLALQAIVMYDPLMRIEDARYEMRTSKKKSRRPRPEENPTQLSMFPLDKKRAEEFAKMGKTMRFFLEVYQEEVTKTRKRKNENLFGPTGRLHGLDFTEYEFFAFWKNFIRHIGEKKFEEQLKRIEQVGENVVLDDYEPTIKFLSSLNSMALCSHNMGRGGCF